MLWHEHTGRSSGRRRRQTNSARLDQLVDLMDDALAMKVDTENVGHLLHEDLADLQGADEDLGVGAGEHGRDLTGDGQVLEQAVQNVEAAAFWQGWVIAIFKKIQLPIIKYITNYL
jgi:hypothetical protein